jgi:hypothetical protein
VKLVRNRVDARHLPARHNFALFRLFAYLRSLRTTPRTEDVILVLDRNQSNTETHLVGWWYLLTLTCFTSTLFRGWALPLALLVSLPVTLFAIEVPIVSFGLLVSALRIRSIRATSFAAMALLASLAAYFAMTQTTWVRFAGLQVFVVFALNGIAAVIAFLLREPIARLEATFGGAESAL